MKYYYAIFKQTKEAIEVEFPDLPGCLTFGDTWEESLEMATDALAAWMATSEPKHIKEPSTHEEIRKAYPDPDIQIQSVALDPLIMAEYEPKKRVNVTLSERVLMEIETFKKATKLTRSSLLELAAEEYMHTHADLKLKRA